MLFAGTFSRPGRVMVIVRRGWGFTFSKSEFPVLFSGMDVSQTVSQSRFGFLLASASSKCANSNWSFQAMFFTPYVAKRHIGFEKKSNFHVCERATGELFVDFGSKVNGEHESDVKNVVSSEFGA